MLKRGAATHPSQRVRKGVRSTFRNAIIACGSVACSHSLSVTGSPFSASPRRLQLLREEVHDLPPCVSARLGYISRLAVGRVEEPVVALLVNVHPRRFLARRFHSLDERRARRRVDAGILA